MDLVDKTAIVTGAGRGLGRAFALRLARLGADMTLVDIDPQSAARAGEPLTAASVADEVRALGRRCLDLTADVARRGAVDDLVARTHEEFRRIDILVNNVGGMLKALPDNSAASIVADEDIADVFATNLLSTIYGCQAVAPIMVAQGGGVIVNVSTRAGANVHAQGKLAAMAVAKAGVNHYTRYLAAELGPRGVRVNCLAPGPIQMTRDVAQPADSVPLRRLGTVEDCANALEFLATDMSSFVTGQVLSVCGGLVLHPS